MLCTLYKYVQHVQFIRAHIALACGLFYFTDSGPPFRMARLNLTLTLSLSQTISLTLTILTVTLASEFLVRLMKIKVINVRSMKTYLAQSECSLWSLVIRIIDDN